MPGAKRIAAVRARAGRSGSRCPTLFRNLPPMLNVWRPFVHVTLSWGSK